MIDIEQRAVTTFQNNFAYFAQHHPNLHHKINLLQNAIQAGQYRENYALEYIDGCFDVKELASGHFLYGENRSQHAHDAAERVNLKKNESVIGTLYHAPYTKANTDDLDKLTIINSPMVGSAPIVRFVNEHTAGLQEMKKIYKFIFFGTGIGEHLASIHDKIHADSYLIVEDNLELFRLSMFVADYQKLGSSSRLFFSVMDTPGDFKITYNLFAEDMFIRNSHLKFHLFSEHYAPKIKQIQNFAVTQPYLMYPYSYLLHKNLRVSHAIEGHYDFLNIQKPFEDSPFAGKPVLYLAAGPSLSRHIEWVKAYQDRFVIVAVFMISAKLEAAGITPDIVVHVDEGISPVQKTIGNLHDTDFLKNTIFVLAASAPLELFGAVATKENIFLMEDRTRYKKDHGFIEFFSVGEVGYTLSLIFGTKELYLLGLDLAVDQATGKTHTDGHSTKDAVDLSKAEATPEESGSLRDTVLKVKGNRCESVATTPLFDASIHKINHYTGLYKKEDQQIYNLGDGAYFQNTRSAAVEDVDSGHYAPLSKSDVRHELLSYLKTHATDRLTDEERNDIVVRKKEIKKKAKIIERFARQQIKNLEDFRNQYVKLVGELIAPVKPALNETGEIFLNYFMTVSGHIGNLLNTDGLERTEPVAKELHAILVRQLYKMLHAFGCFGFNYLNGEKYFDVGQYRELQNDVLTLKLRADDTSQIDLAYFTEKLHYMPMHTDGFRDAFGRGCISFLAIAENLTDSDFTAYIDALSERFPHLRINAFYFSDHDLQNAREVFKNANVNLMFLDAPETLAEHTEVYIDGIHMSNYLRVTVNDFLTLHCPNIQIITYRPPSLPETVSGFDQSSNMRHQKVLEHPERFGYTRALAEENGFNVYKMHQNAIRAQLNEPLINDDDSVYEINFFDSVALAMKHPAFKQHFNKIRTLMKQLA